MLTEFSERHPIITGIIIAMLIMFWPYLVAIWMPKASGGLYVLGIVSAFVILPLAIQLVVCFNFKQRTLRLLPLSELLLCCCLAILFFITYDVLEKYVFGRTGQAIGILVLAILVFSIFELIGIGFAWLVYVLSTRHGKEKPLQ